MSRRNAVSLQAVPDATSERQSLVSADKMNELDMRLLQIRAINDLIQTADKESLFEDTIELAAYSISLLVDEARELVASRTLAP